VVAGARRCQMWCGKYARSTGSGVEEAGVESPADDGDDAELGGVGMEWIQKQVMGSRHDCGRTRLERGREGFTTAPTCMATYDHK
jgi:hypothetical protein